MSRDTNKHQDSAARLLDLSRTAGLTPHQVETSLQRAQVEATLAVAEELRTTNQIAFVTKIDDSHGTDLFDQIAERLGMA